MKTKLLFLCFFFVQFLFSQQNPREILNGQIVADSISVENVKIVNKTTNTFSVSDAIGMFHMYARESDTLVFSSQAFDSRILVLSAADFKVKLLRVKLDVFVNSLDEVVISPHALTGDLNTDGKNITLTEVRKVKATEKLYEDDNQSTPDNKLMPGYLDTRYMVDFMALGKKLVKLLKKKDEPKPIVYTSSKIFPLAVQENLPDSFFRETLKLDKNEVGLFLAFCESDPKSRELLNPKRKFELIDFLINKNKEYQETKSRD